MGTKQVEELYIKSVHKLKAQTNQDCNHQFPPR
jgi:hypothetical protein